MNSTQLERLYSTEERYYERQRFLANLRRRNHARHSTLGNWLHALLHRR